jgi:hypothetical protein
MNEMFGMEWYEFSPDAAAINNWEIRVFVPLLELEMRTSCMQATRRRPVAELVHCNRPQYELLYFLRKIR